MEIFLNSLWLAIALASFGLWGRRIFRGRGSNGLQAGVYAQFLALIVAIFLVFPWISLSDDLQARVSTAENPVKISAADTKSGRSQGPRDRNSLQASAAIVPSSNIGVFGILAAWGQVEIRPPAAPRNLAAPCGIVRGPPSLLFLQSV